MHTAPGHGADDYNIWMEKVGGPIPSTVNADGYYTKERPASKVPVSSINTASGAMQTGG